MFRPNYIKISNQDKSNTPLEIDKIIEIFNSEEKNNNQLIEKIERHKDKLNKLEYNKKISINDINELDILFELGMQEYLNIDVYNEKDICFNELSQGERIFYNHFLFVSFIKLNHSQSKEKENTFFLIDEPDTTFHPKWQKKYLSGLLNIYKKYEKNIHLIITSHSPYILSDLPKENVIFLENGIQKDPFKDKQTFGANIHTLLSDGFFMKDGLMGEFAKDKIQSIIKYHDEILKKDLKKKENIKRRNAEKLIYEKEHKTHFWQIQSIIGDDYLKQVIKNHLMEIEKIVLGNDEAKKEEILRLKQQINLLENQEC
ncbi:MAG: AAA family ATPase [Arcobacteraceae bacterium]